MSVPVQGFLKRRRDRAVGSILGYVEREVFPRLPEDERSRLRRVVLDALNGYHDSVLDLVKSEDGVVRNGEVLAMLERLDRHLGRQVQTGVDSRRTTVDDTGVQKSREVV